MRAAAVPLALAAGCAYNASVAAGSHSRSELRVEPLEKEASLFCDDRPCPTAAVEQDVTHRSLLAFFPVLLAEVASTGFVMAKAVRNSDAPILWVPAGACGILAALDLMDLVLSARTASGFDQHEYAWKQRTALDFEGRRVEPQVADLLDPAVARGC